MKFLRVLGSEIVLGTLVAVLSVMTAVGSYMGSMSDSEQNKYEILGMQKLNDGNAEYLTANQNITQDYAYFDNWYLNVDTNADIAEYYQVNFSDELTAAVERSGEDNPFDDAYYDAMYQYPGQLFDESDADFQVGAQWDERGDQLQLVVLIMALGLAFAAWASLLKEESMMRLLFAALAIIALVAGVISFLAVPAVTA